MNPRRESCFLILVVALESVSAFHCLTNCTCKLKNDPERFMMYCPTENNPMVTVRIVPAQFVYIRCFGSLHSPYFPLDGITLTKHENIKSMYYTNCELPSNNSLSEIAQILGVTNIEKLYISLPSIKIYTSIRHFLCDFENLENLESLIKQYIFKYDNLVSDQSSWMQFNLTMRKLHSGVKFFNCTPGLERLNLNINELIPLELSTLDNLKNLTSLSTSFCVLNELQSRFVEELEVLETLELTKCSIARLLENIYPILENLKYSNLSKDSFIHIPTGQLQNNKTLNTVYLIDSYNDIRTLPNYFFASLTKLQSVSLGFNSFITLPEDLFWGCTSLTNINLRANLLQTLPVHLFRNLKELKQLDLSFNKIETLPDHIFSNTNKLVRLDLSRNRITSISEHLFNGLYSLEELNMEANQLMTIAINGFSSLKELKIARLSKNHLSSEYVNNRTFYAFCEALEEVYLADNNISEISFNSINTHPRLRVWDLRNNNITSITINMKDLLRSYINNMKVDLTYNKIKHIFLHNLDMYLREKYVYKNIEILVDNNPLHCDCQLKNFLRYIKSKNNLNFNSNLNIILGGLTCQSPKELENVLVKVWRRNLLVCDIVADSNCPKKCNCSGRLKDNTFIFDCSERNLSKMPHDIKKPDYPIRFELNFSGNRLTRMPDLKAMELESVKDFILSHNSISEISLDGLSSTIEVLELHNNNLSRIHSDVLEFLKQSTKLTRLTLHENPWECDCDAKEFQRFIRSPTKNVTIYDLHKVKCVGTNISISEYDFCLMNTTTIIGITTAISLIGIFVGFFGLYYKYERRIKVWLFAHQWCLWFVTEEELDKEKLYDAFVSYSHKDHDFVVSELVSELENGSTPFKLCLHFRDWVVGEWIPANIINSVENSRRTIVVLSPNFLESVWGRLEFRAAHSQALNEGRARVILILYGDIGPTDNLDPELKAYINMNTYVTWEDPWFWDKLKYALPHQPKLVRHSADRNIISENHQLSLQTNGDQGCQN